MNIAKTSASLVYFQILDENPMMNRVYTTGAFFMIMMYTGSNILPISRFLKLTHLKQNTYYAQQVGEFKAMDRFLVRFHYFMNFMIAFISRGVPYGKSLCLVLSYRKP